MTSFRPDVHFCRHVKVDKCIVVKKTVLCRYDPKTNQWSSDVAPTSTCRTSVGVAVLGGFLYAVGGQDGVSCLNIVER